MVKLTVNGKAEEVDMPADTPLLWALRDHLGLTGTKLYPPTTRFPDVLY